MGNGISVTIGGNADPLLNEFKRVKNAAGAVSYKLIKGFRGGSGGHGGKTGAISEAIVMARELSRGNFSRLPGSFSLLLQRSGALAKILPFILNPITGIAAGLLAGAAAAYKLNNYLVSSLTGLDHAELKMSYIPKHLQSINRAVEAQKELNLEVSRAVELYHGVAEQSERTVEAVRKQFDHLRKMNELTEHDPSKREKNRVGLDNQERAEMLRLQANEELALQKESQRKLKAAQEFIQGTPSAAQDEANVKYRESDLAKGEEDLKKREAEKSKMMEGYNSMSGSDVSSADLANAMTSNKNDIESRRKAVADAIETKAANDEKRKAYEQMISDAKKDAEQAAKLHESRKDRADAANKDSANELEESNANTKSKFAKMHVSSLQAIGGGYVRPAAFETIARQQLHHLSNIDRQTKGGGNKGGGTSKGAF